MGSMNGVVVSDPFLASQFTQKELRLFKTEFDSLKNEDGLLPAAKLENKISFLEQPLSKDEIDVIMQTEDPHHSGDLDFEGFLRMYVGLQKHGSTKISPQKPTFLRTTTTTWVHTISDSEKKAYVEHINTYLADDYALSELLPIDPRTDDVFEIVKDGILICKLINIAVPGTIDERALNIKTKLNPWERVENHTLSLNSAKAIGCSVVNIGTEDLAEGRPHLVLGLISQIVKIHLLADVNLKMRPELAEMVTDTEEIEEFLHLSAEKVLLRWMNFHLKKAGYSKEVSNFSSDLKDGEAYTVLLNVLAPESCDLSPLDINDPQERARAILAQAENIDCRKYVSPRDIWEGSTNLNLAFVANLFHQRNGLTLDSNKISFAEMLEDHENDSREERTFRMWINSLGIATHLHDLFGDVRDGWVLLEVLDKVAPGSVNWKLANKPPIKMPFRKVENCNQAVDIGKRLKFSMVNIAGHDVVQGNRKLIIAYLWQLMRYNALQLLKNLRLRGKEVSDADIIEWANRKVKRLGRGSRMESFKDPSLSNGLFFLDLLSAVEPRVVNWRLVTKGETDEDKRQNANYAISVARKLGCSIFLLWDDIVEVRPKMIMILAASIMLWGLSQDAKKAAATASVLELHEDNGSTTN